MTEPILQAIKPLSPFRFDTAPEGEADVANDPIYELSSWESSSKAWGSDGLCFTDFLDIVNPLQHIPILSTLYRKMTNDQISEAPKLIGAALFGGPAGFLAGITDSLVKAETGLTIGETLFGRQQELSPTNKVTADVKQNPHNRRSENHPLNEEVFTQTSNVLVDNNIAQNTPQTNPDRWFPVPQRRLPNPIPVSASATSLYVQKSEGITAQKTNAQHALDRLVSVSKISSGNKSIETPLSKQNPSNKISDPNNVRQWMLQALTKYESMQTR